MREIINKYLMLLCLTGGLLMPDIGWCEMHAARALSQIGGTESIRVQVTSSEDDIKLDYSVPGAEFTSLDEQSPCPQGTCTKTNVVVGNAKYIPQEGKPLLPIISSIVIIPSGKAIDHITVSRTGEIEYEGEYFLDFGEKVSTISSTSSLVRALPDASIYYSNNPFPTETHTLVTVQKKCGVTIAYINLNPIIYYPLSGRVLSYDDISLTVNLKAGTGVPDYPVACRPERIHPERMGIENPEALETYLPNSAGIPLPGGICDPVENYQYVIITNEEIKNYPGDFNIQFLLDWRINQCALTATAVAVEDIYPNYPGTSESEKIRNFIRDAFNNWETEYVLLCGDPDYANIVVPMVTLWGVANTDPPLQKNIHSDVYYQCLDGVYNFDGDGRLGETNDGDGGNDVDLTAEVYIGRACVENPVEAYNFIKKTIEHEQAVLNDDTYLNNFLMTGEILISPPKPPFYSRENMEEIRLGSNNHGFKTFGFDASSILNEERMYDRDAVWSTDDMINEINSDSYGIINHLGHGQVFEFMRMNMRAPREDIKKQTNTKLPFLYSQACLAGFPVFNSVGEEITTTYEYGMWGAALNTREGLFRGYTTDGPSQRYNRQFWDAYIYDGMSNAGALIVASHEENLFSITDVNTRWCYFTTNLFCDPYSFFKDPIPCERNLYMKIFAGYKDILARKSITTENVSIAKLPGSTNVTFASGEEIRMLPGFSVQAGAEFKAYIDPILYKSDCE